MTISECWGVTSSDLVRPGETRDNAIRMIIIFTCEEEELSKATEEPLKDLEPREAIFVMSESVEN